MTKIKKYIEHIDDEICGAKEYAEKSLEYKAAGNNDRYAKYRQMASDELSHAMTVHDMAVQDIEALKAVYPDIPTEMMEEWEKSHKRYVEKVAWVKQMLAM